jgi:hypothetical protein
VRFAFCDSVKVSALGSSFSHDFMFQVELFGSQKETDWQFDFCFML